MNNDRLLISAMAERCRATLQEAPCESADLPEPLRRAHLLWMCRQIAEHAEDWTDTRLHRWIGFVQCGLLATRSLNFEAVKAMFNEAKAAYGTREGDCDLADHLDPARSFQLELGGEG